MNPNLQHSIVYDKDLGNSPSVLLDVWIYFNLIANNILLPILLLTTLVSSRVQRCTTFINMCLTWILSGVFSLLLFYARQYTDSEPPKALCIAQASLLFGIVPMWSVAVLAVFYNVYRSYQHRCCFNKITWWSMLAGPYVFQVTFSVAALIISLRRPDLVSRQAHFFYCGLRSHPLVLARTVLVTLCTGCTFIIEVLLLWRLYTISGVIHIRRTPPCEDRVEYLAKLLRVLIFGLHVILGLAVDLLTYINGRSVLPQIYMATTGAFLFVVFGTQTAILSVWFPCKLCRRRKPRRVSNRPYNRNYPDRLQGAQPMLYLGPPDQHQVNGRAQQSQTSSRAPSFTLDDLFPPYPEPALTASVPLYYTHYSI